ncbi:MAG: PLP-dependent aspartate aminotransferase family protein [Chitinophagales bacterium]|nr:PLP-dependent aspartate aminotransferase family protein [Chitinophagales bacterium]MDW8272871.1 PLP-dependent aspartate aminotransferase family protein [Chitinophagales bacterium]
MDYSYIINHLNEERDDYFGAVSPALIQTSNFAFSNVAQLRKAIFKEDEHYLYSRGKNPTTDILCSKLAALANAESALVFSSGMAAMSSAILSLVKAGDHVICQLHPYSWTKRLCSKILPSFGVSVSFADGTLTENIIRECRSDTKLIILESPNTFTFELQNLAEVVSFAQEKEIYTIIDNSYCTSLGQRCIDMGISLEVHSMSKYYSGHSDVVAGCVIGKKELIEKIFVNGLQNLGGILSPFDAWLTLRGLRTLAARMEKIAKTTAQVVDFLYSNPRVEKVLYPFHHSFAQYDLAQKQMSWCGGLFSILLNAKDMHVVENFVNKLKRFMIAVSWGGHESLVFPACAAMPEGKPTGHLPYNLVRFYCGLEEPGALIEDLKQALDQI